MKNGLTKVFALAFIISQVILFIQVYFTSSYAKEVAKYKEENTVLKNRIDSINSELYPSALELNRYQIGYRIFAKRYPKEASHYADIISNETK